MFGSVLIANRGEIACRIARTAKRLGLRTIAVFSDADANALHVRMCDQAHRIGPAAARESYLVADALLEAARRSRADCIHPGYGFLSENADFADLCEKTGIAFVGPPASAIRAMGLKDRAKALMEKAGVPVVPGYHGEQQDPKLLKRKAYEIGYPVLIKAVAGGGGKGMRRVDRHADFEEALQGAMREAASAFGDERVLIEKYVAVPRHIEIQVFADRHGNVVHLNERDCSLQRRHQKVIEEAPAPGMTQDLRRRMGEAATAAARAVSYTGAGTVEFIADGADGLKADGFWFMEMNTRLQVEHPVTEAVTGLDLVEWQFRVAAGERLPFAQDDIALKGHAVEARVYAEDPERGFLPSTGRIAALSFPQKDGIRIDTGFETGGEVLPYYDPMIAKVIAHAPSREQALDRLAGALDRTQLAGPRSNLAFLANLCRAWDFRAGNFDTGFIERNLAALGAVPQDIDASVAAAGLAYLLERQRARIAAHRAGDEPDSPWNVGDGFQLSGPRRMSVVFSADGKPVIGEISYEVHGASVRVADAAPDASAALVPSGENVFVLRKGRQTYVALTDFEAGDVEQQDGDGVVRAPMHGKVLAVLVEKGAVVKKGQRLALLEAMKMEHALTAPADGIVEEVLTAAGSQVAEGAKLVVLSSAPGAA